MSNVATLPSFYVAHESLKTRVNVALKHLLALEEVHSLRIALESVKRPGPILLRSNWTVQFKCVNEDTAVVAISTLLTELHPTILEGDWIRTNALCSSEAQEDITVSVPVTLVSGY